MNLAKFRFSKIIYLHAVVEVPVVILPRGHELLAWDRKHCLISRGVQRPWRETNNRGSRKRKGKMTGSYAKCQVETQKQCKHGDKRVKQSNEVL